MEVRQLPFELTFCKVSDVTSIDFSSEFFFVGKTDEEISLVCQTSEVPSNTVAREDGWRGFVIEGVLDFSLVGILSKVSSMLAAAGIGIFAVSTYNTDYILVKSENFCKATDALAAEGDTIKVASD